MFVGSIVVFRNYGARPAPLGSPYPPARQDWRTERAGARPHALPLRAAGQALFTQEPAATL